MAMQRRNSKSSRKAADTGLAPLQSKVSGKRQPFVYGSGQTTMEIPHSLNLSAPESCKRHLAVALSDAAYSGTA